MLNRAKNILFAVSLVCSLVFLTNFFSTKAYGQKPKTLKTGYIPINAVLPLFAAIENGYLQERGLQVDLMPLAGGAVTVSAVLGGSIDIGFAAYISLFAARDKGMDIIALAPSNSEIGWPQPFVGLLALDNSGINNAKDLEGKKVAVPTLNSLDWLTISEWASKNGADPRKFHWVELPYPSQPGALRNRVVDAIGGVDPFFTLESATGGVKVVTYYYAEFDPHMPIAGFLVTESWLNRNRDFGIRFLRAIQEGTNYVNSHPKERGDLLVKYTKMKSDLAGKLRFYPAFDRVLDPTALQRSIDLTLKWGFISKRLNARDMAVPEALK